MNKLDYGCTLYIDHDNIIITDDYEIMARTNINGTNMYVSLGYIEDEITYFYHSIKPYPGQINSLIYMGDNKFTFKRIMTPYEEFIVQDNEIRKKIFDELYYSSTMY